MEGWQFQWEVFDLESNGDPLELLYFICLCTYVFVRLKKQITDSTYFYVWIKDSYFSYFYLHTHDYTIAFIILIYTVCYKMWSLKVLFHVLCILTGHVYEKTLPPKLIHITNECHIFKPQNHSGFIQTKFISFCSIAQAHQQGSLIHTVIQECKWAEISLCYTA